MFESKTQIDTLECELSEEDLMTVVGGAGGGLLGGGKGGGLLGGLLGGGTTVTVSGNSSTNL